MPFLCLSTNAPACIASAPYALARFFSGGLPMRRRLFPVVGLVLVFLVAPLGAQTKPSGAPPELEAWRDWVLYDQEEAQCPSLYQMPNPKLCAWPSRLDLDIAADGGKFRQTWRVFAPTRVPLPGNASSWPSRDN